MGKAKAPPAPPSPAVIQQQLVQAQIAQAPQIIAAQREFGPQFAQVALQQQRQFAPQAADIQRQFQERLAPGAGAVQENLARQLAQRLATPGTPQAALDVFRERLRTAQAQRGIARSALGAVGEARSLAELSEASAAQTRQQALQFLSVQPRFQAPSFTPQFGVSPGTAVQAAGQIGQQQAQQFAAQQQAGAGIFGAGLGLAGTLAGIAFPGGGAEEEPSPAAGFFGQALGAAVSPITGAFQAVRSFF